MVGTWIVYGVWWSFGTLLGPGITGPSPVPFAGLVVVLVFLVSRAWPKPHSLHPLGACVVVGVTGLLFGNCIVDASIL